MSETGIRWETAGDEGFSLMEVVVSFFVFTLLSLAVLATLDGALGLTRTNQGRVVAANLAAKAIEVARTAEVSSLSDQPPVAAPVTVDGTTYTVTTAAHYVATVGAASACDGPAGRIVAQRVNVSVTWPRMGATAPVRSDTLRNVDADAVTPALGTLAVRVKDRLGVALPASTVTLTPGSGLTATTDSAGCAVFSGLPPRTDYVVTAVSDRVDREGVTPPRRTSITVRAKELTFEELWHDVPGTVSVPAPHSGWPVPATAVGSVATAHDNLRAGAKTFPCTVGGCSATPLFPFTSAYRVSFTACTTQQLGSHVVGPAGTATTARVMGPLQVRVLSTNAGGQSPVFEANDAIFAVDTCGTVHQLSGTRSGEGFTQASLPLGTYTLRYRRASTTTVSNTSPPTTVTLTNSATSGAPAITLTYVR